MMNRREWITGVAGVSALGACQSTSGLVGAPRAASVFLSPPENALREDFALQALDRYLETWNTRDPKRWATSIAFPHVRPGAGGFEVFLDEQQYVAAQNFDAVLAQGWRYTRWDKRQVLQTGLKKVHAAGWWRRYREDGSTLATSQICYIIVPTNGRPDGDWRIQSRFATGRTDQVTPEEQARNLVSARAALDAYTAAFDSQDPERLATAVHYPHVRHGDGRLEWWTTKAAYLAGPEPGRARAWAGTRLRNIRDVGISINGVSFTLVYDRLGADGLVQASYDALYLVTTAENDPAWKVRAISTFGP